MKRVTMSVREHSGFQGWWKSSMFVGRPAGLMRASQVLLEGFCRQQS